MAELINQGTFFHSLLIDAFRSNEDRSLQIKNFAHNIIDLFSNFTIEINSSCRKFFKKLKVDQDEDQSIIILSKFIIDILNQLSKKVTLMTKKIQSEVVDPMNIFIQNQIQNQKVTVRKSEEMLYSIEANSEFLKELNKNFILNEKSNLEEQEKNLLKDIYEDEINKCNEKWMDIKAHYSKILEEVDILNSSRCNFTLKMQVLAVKLINKLVNSTSVEDSLHEYEELWCENLSMSIGIKEKLRDKLGKLILLEESYEDRDENGYHNTLGNYLSGLMNSQSEVKEKHMVDDFVGIFTCRSNLREEESHFEESRTLVLQNMKWTNYFLNKLKSSLHTEIKLSNLKFRELTTILKYIFAIIVEVNENEAVLYNLLYISYKVRCNDQYMIKELGKHEDFWRNRTLWENIITYIQTVRFKVETQERGSVRHLQFKKIFNRDTWIRPNKISTEKKIKSQKFIQDAKFYEILCEINYFMAKLQINESFIFEFMLCQASKYGISKENTRKLLQFHYLNKISITNKSNSSFLKRKQRLEHQMTLLKKSSDKASHCVGMALKYLTGSKDLLRLLYVSKSWNQHLKKQILKRFMIQENNQTLVNKVRIKIYKQICHPPFSKSVYNRMIEEVPEFTQHTEIIQLDARRSLSWDEKLRGQMIEVLKAYAFYHHDVGYLQGMNYLCENILKITDDTFIVYSIFQHLMNNQYYGLYTGAFEGLKLKIYQFMRILQRERPELYDHLRAEKLEGEHFLLSWAITLWGEMSGDLCWTLWDGFLIEGWTWWFKTILWLLTNLEAEILQMNFEEIMKCFSDLHSSLLCYSLKELSDYGIDKDKIKNQIDSIRIQPEVLIQIEMEYKLKASTINEYLNRGQPKKKQAY